MSDLRRTFLLMLRGWTFLSLFFSSFYASAQVIVTPAIGAETVCIGPSQIPITDITIAETNPTDFASDGVDKTIVFNFDAGGPFIFVAGVGSVSVTGTHVNSSSLVANVGSIEVTVNLDPLASTEINTIVITGIQVVGNNTPGSAELIRISDSPSSKNLDILGDNPADGKSHGSFTAYDPPTASITNDKSSTICATEIITFSGLPGAASNYEFILDPAGARTSLQSSASGLYSTSSLSNGDEVAVIVTDANGCVGESAGNIITVNAGYTGALTSNDADNTICDGDPVTFTATTSGATSGTVNYAFYKNFVNVQAASTINQYSSSTLADGDEVWAIVTDASTCSPTTNTINQIVVNPSNSLTVTAASNSITSGSSANITVSNSEIGIDYQLQDNSNSNPLSAVFAGNGTDLLLTSSALTSNVTIKVVASSSIVSGCSTTLLETEIITVTGGGGGGAPSASSPAPICIGGTIPTLTATGTNIEWYSDPGLTTNVASGASYTPTAPEVDDTTAGTYSFYVTQNTGTESAAIQVDVVVNAPPSAAVAGIDITQCEDEIFVLGATAPATGSGTWSEVGGPAGINITNTASENTTVTGLAAGNLATLRWTVSNAGCTDETDDMIITNDVLAIADAGAGGDVCGIGVGNEFTFTGTGTSGSWTKESGPGTETFGDAAIPTTTVSVDAAGTYVFRWTETNGSCSDFDEITVNFTALPDNSLAVTPAAVNVCENTATSIAVALSENSYQYQLFDNVADTAVSAIYIGNGGNLNLNTFDLSSNITIKVSATSGLGCTTDLTNTTSITIDQMPTIADAGSNINQCNNGTFAALGGNTPAIGTGTWTVATGTATITVFNSPTTQVTGVSEGTVARLDWTITNGVCPASVDQVILRNREQPVAVVATSNITCNSVSDGYIDITISKGTPNYIYTLGGDVTATQIQPGLNYRFDGLNAGNYTIDVIDDNGCSIAPEPGINLTQPAALNPDAYEPDGTTNFDVCGSYDFASNATVATGTGAWSKTSGPGTLSFSAGPNVPDQTLTVDAYGTYVFRWTDDNGVCIEYDEITVNFYEQPIAEAGLVATEECDLDIQLLGLQSVMGSTASWSVTAGIATDITFSNSSLFNPTATSIIYGTYTFTLTETNSSCSSTDDIVVTYSEQPIANAGAGGDVCGIGAGSPFTFTGVASAGTGTWTKESGSGAETFGNANLATTTVSVDAAGTYVFRWTEVNGACSDFEEITVNFIEPPSAAVAGGDIAQCDNSTFIMGATVPAVGTGIWSEVGGPAGIMITNASSATTAVTGLAAGSTATLRWTVSNGACAANTDDVVLTNNAAPTTATAGPDQEQCNSGAFTLAGNNPAVGTGLWTIQGAANGVVITTPTAFNSGVTGLTAGSSVTLRWTISSAGCTESYDEVTLTNTSIPVLDAGVAAETCEDALFTVVDASASNGTGISWIHDGNGSIFNATTLNPIYLPVATDAGSTVTLTMNVGGNGSCGSEVDTKALTITEAPTAYAGATSATCEDAPYSVSDAAVSNASSTLWSHNGFGSIIASTTLNPTYNPVPADGGTLVTLTLTATGYGSCTVATSEKILQINAIPVFTITNNPGEPATISSGESTDIDIQIASGGNVMLSDVRTSSTALSGYSTVGTIYPDGFKLQDELINSSNNTEWIEYDFTASAGGCVNAVMQTVRVIVNPAPHMMITNHNPTICSGETANIDLSSLTVNAVIELANVSTSPDAGSVTGITSVGTDWDSGLGELPAALIDNLVNSTNNIQTVTYEFIVSAPGFASTSTQLVQVIVNPTAFLSVTNTNTTINSGAVTDILLNTPTENGTITLLSVSKTDPLLIGNTLPGASFPNGTRLEDVLLNSSFSPQDITYEFQVSANGCVNASTFSTSVSVSPAPEMSLVNNYPEICSGGSTDIVVNSVTSDATIELINVSISPNATGITGFTAVGSIWTSAALELPVLITDNLTNSTNDIQTITYEFEVSASGYTGTNLLIAEVTVNPTPDMTITNTKATINSGAATEILINSSTENGQIAIKNLVKTDPALIGNTAVGTLFTDGARLEDVLLNSTPSAQIITYMFEARGNGCINPSLVSTDVTVNPAPEMTVTNNILSICPGEITDIDVSSVTTDAVIELIDVSINPNTSGITGSTPVGTTWKANLSEIPFTIGDNLVNNTDTIQTITYEFEVSASGFTSTLTQTAVIELNPMPSQLITNSNTTINSGLTTDILIQTSTENGQIALKSITKTDPALIGNTGVGTLFPNDTRIEDVLLNTSISPQMITYEFEATANGCANPGTFIANVTVNPAPAMTLTNNSPTICSEETIYIEANSSTVNSIVELKSIAIFPNAAGVTGYTAVGTTWESNLSELPVIITDALVNNTNSIQTITYEFEVTAGGFTSSTTVTTDVVVNPTPALTIANSGMTINSGSATNILINTPTQNGMVNLKSVSKTDPVLVGNSAAGVSFVDGAILVDVLLNSTYDTQTVTYEFEARANGCISPSTTTTDVTVIPLPEMILASNSPILCSSETTDIVLSSPTFGADIELIAVNTAPDVGSVTGITPLNTSWNSFPATIGDQLVNTTNVAQTVEYVFQVSVLGFNNPVTQSVFVEVRPIPNIAAITQGICSEDVTQVNILNPNNVSFTVFNWTTNNIGAVIGESDGTGNLISQQLINSSPLLDSIVYKVYATALSCAGDSIEVVQYVHPRNIANAGFDTIVCEGTPVINIESAFIGGSATDILWTNLDGDGVLSNTTSLVPSYTPASLPADEVGTINLQLTASDTSVCPAASDIVSLVINSKPVVNAGTDRIICETSSVNLNGSFAGAATGSTWSTSGDGTFSFVGDLNASYLPGTNDKSSGSATLTLITNDPIGPCLAATDDIFIQVDAAATADAGSYAPTCIGDTIYLNGVIGGAAGSAMWSGGLGTFINPTQLNAAYVPASLEQGSDVMLSLITDDPAGACFTETSQTLIAVNRLPLTNFEGLSASYQVDDAAVILEGFPGGGVFSGTGIVGSTFSPALADVGTHLVRYDFTGINGCSNYVEEITVVNALPVAEIADPGPYCFNDDPINNPMPRTARSGFEDSWSGEHIFIKNGEYYFNHAVSGIGEFQVDYTIIETATGAVRTEPRNIRINDVPNINFSVLNNCIADTINFIDLSVLDNGDIFNDQIVQWEWRIGDGPDFISTDQNPKIKFDTLKPGDYKVVLTATTKFNCTTSKTSIPGEIKIGAAPHPEFLIRNQTFGMETQFTDNTTIPATENILPDFVDPTSSIDSIWWDFGEASPIEGTYVNANRVYHQYSQGNTDFQVLMTIKTDLGCYATKSTYVSIIESISDFPYDEPFEAYNPDANRGENSSWQLMVPNGNLIKGEAGNNAWITSDLNGRHNNSEHSYVMLPSFDLRSLEKPMLSLDIWSNAENTRDGAIIQFIFDGEDWETLVDPNENISHDPSEQIGLNWYNEKGLISSPGNGIIESSIGSNLSGYGWTGVYSDWKTARFPLDELRDRQLAGASSVRFRVVFSSDQQNTVGTDYDGFAFDNLWIGDRERKILLEHFDNLENTQHRIDSINYWADVYAKDMILLQYHNNYPGPDIIYENNPFPTDTRGAIYDITQSPRSFMDGVMEYDYSGSYLKNYQVINRSLSSPKFDIDLVIEQDGDNKANIVATITARDTLDEQVTLYIMPVETGIYNSSEIVLPAGIDSVNNVVKDMIPPGGREYNMHWVPGTSETFSAYWDMNELLSSNIIYDNTKLGVVVFVQNGENEIDKEIYQATYTRLPELSNIVITGLEDELNAKKFETANIYPIPAQNYFNVALSDQLTIDIDWKIIDQRGIQMLDGNFGSGADTFEVDTNSLPNGLYMFIVSGGSDIKYMRKLIIQR